MIRTSFRLPDLQVLVALSTPSMNCQLSLLISVLWPDIYVLLLQCFLISKMCRELTFQLVIMHFRHIRIQGIEYVHSYFSHTVQHQRCLPLFVLKPILGLLFTFSSCINKPSIVAALKPYSYSRYFKPPDKSLPTP